MNQLALFLQDGPDPVAIQHAVLAILPIVFLFILIGLAIVIVPFWFMCKKAGISPWLAFLNIIPLGNLILMYVLAFADWKVVPAPQGYWQQPPMPPPPQFPPQA